MDDDRDPRFDGPLGPWFAVTIVTDRDVVPGLKRALPGAFITVDVLASLTPLETLRSLEIAAHDQRRAVARRLGVPELETVARIHELSEP